MKWDFAIGNPAYQAAVNEQGDNKTFFAPVYNYFLDEAFKVADKVEMIHPARFLFNAGSTPKAWNEKMLSDPHYKVLEYEEDATKVFSNTDIKGGVVITYHDKSKEFGAIQTFTKYPELNGILRKVVDSETFESINKDVITRTAYRITDVLHRDHPEAIKQLSKGHAYDMSTNIFDRLPQVFFDKRPNDDKKYIKILGREGNTRVYKFIQEDYVNSPRSLHKYKIFLPSANGNGTFGETLTQPVLEGIGVGATETFISVGIVLSEREAQAILKYIKTKFLRTLLNILKTTQHLTPAVWKYVPKQDFSNNSDINWNASIADIDQQLYKKYGLSQEEIDFIETHVKEMA